MSAIRNMYRSFISVMVCFIITFLLGYIWPYIAGHAWLKSACIIIGCLILVFIFQKSYRKQHEFIDKRIQEAISEKENDMQL